MNYAFTNCAVTHLSNLNRRMATPWVSRGLAVEGSEPGLFALFRSGPRARPRGPISERMPDGRGTWSESRGTFAESLPRIEAYANRFRIILCEDAKNFEKDGCSDHELLAYLAILPRFVYTARNVLWPGCSNERSHHSPRFLSLTEEEMRAGPH